MAKSITDILSSVGKDIFTEETLGQIESAFTEAVDTAVADRIQLRLDEELKNVDKKQTDLLKKVVAALEEKRKRDIKAVSEQNAAALNAVVARYDQIVNETAVKHRDALFEQLDAYLDEHLEAAIPTEQLKQLAENRYAQGLLKKASEILGINESVVTAEVRESILEGQRMLNAVQEQNKRLKSEIESLKGVTTLHEKLKGLPAAKRDFILEKLDGKSADFVERNFDFVSKEFDKNQETQRESIKKVVEEATKNPGYDRLVAENTQPESTPDDSGLNPAYLEGLKANG